MAGLAAANANGQSHAELEERLAGQGRELLRQLLQDHLDLRAVREQRQQRVIDAEQVARTRVEGGHERGLATVFGQVTVSRMGYRAPGARNLYPADAILNLPAELHSFGLRKLAAVESVRGSFEQAAAAIERQAGVRIGKRQLEAMAQAAAVDIEAFYAAGRPPPAEPDRLLVLSFDGKGIVMIPSALREATAGPRPARAASFPPGYRLPVEALPIGPPALADLAWRYSPPSRLAHPSMMCHHFPDLPAVQCRAAGQSLGQSTYRKRSWRQNRQFARGG